MTSPNRWCVRVSRGAEGHGIFASTTYCVARCSKRKFAADPSRRCPRMKIILAAVIAIAVLAAVDLEFNGGRYTAVIIKVIGR